MSLEPDFAESENLISTNSASTMKTTLYLITAIASILAISAMAQTEEKKEATEKKVALRNTAEKPARYVTMVPKGGLNISSTEIADRQVFTLVDTNGGELADGDEVQIKLGEGKDVNYWYETGDNKIGRIGRPTDKSSTRFKIKKTDAGISLQTASGKFVAATSKTDNLTVTDAAEKAVVFEVI